jgi:hypothetical protein
MIGNWHSRLYDLDARLDEVEPAQLNSLTALSSSQSCKPTQAPHTLAIGPHQWHDPHRGRERHDAFLA